MGKCPIHLALLCVAVDVHSGAAALVFSCLDSAHLWSDLFASILAPVLKVFKFQIMFVTGSSVNQAGFDRHILLPLPSQMLGDMCHHAQFM